MKTSLPCKKYLVFKRVLTLRKMFAKRVLFGSRRRGGAAASSATRGAAAAPSSASPSPLHADPIGSLPVRGSREPRVRGELRVRRLLTPARPLRASALRLSSSSLLFAAFSATPSLRRRVSGRSSALPPTRTRPIFISAVASSVLLASVLFRRRRRGVARRGSSSSSSSSSPFEPRSRSRSSSRRVPPRRRRRRRTRTATRRRRSARSAVRPGGGARPGARMRRES